MWNPFSQDKKPEEEKKERKLATIVELEEPNYFPTEDYEALEQPPIDSAS